MDAGHSLGTRHHNERLKINDLTMIRFVDKNPMANGIWLLVSQIMKCDVYHGMVYDMVCMIIYDIPLYNIIWSHTHCRWLDCQKMLQAAWFILFKSIVVYLKLQLE